MRVGISTGTCATAAATAAARVLRGVDPSEITSVEVTLPVGEVVEVAVIDIELRPDRSACASVVKDAGDDIDVTDKATIHVCVELDQGEPGVRFVAGEGVGTVTREGLQLAVGEPAINPVPREMIRAALVRELGDDVAATVTVSVPDGVELARKTFNPRLGIVGGISIIGTSGRVEPKSDEAWMRSLLPQVSMARAAGHDTLYLAPGGIGERYAIDTLGAPDTAVVQCSNFVGDLLDACAEAGAKRVVLVGHVGKLAKVAAGIFNTHSRFGDARLETVAALAALGGASASLVERVLALPTVQAAIDLLRENDLEHTWSRVALRARDRAAERVESVLDIDVVLLGYRDELLATTIPSRGVAQSPQPLVIVGVGPGDTSLVTPAASARIASAEVLMGGTRLLEEFAPTAHIAEHIVLGADVASGLREAATVANAGKRTVVLASGDPSFFGILATIRRELPDAPIEVVPGISSAQIALARTGERWEQTAFISAHGRDLAEAVDAVLAAQTSLVLTDRDNTPPVIARALLESDPAVAEAEAVVLERLSYADERIGAYSLSTLAASSSDSFSPLSLVLVRIRRKEPRS